MSKLFRAVLFVAVLMVVVLAIQHYRHAEGVRTIGVIQYVHQPLLDETARGLVAGLTSLGLNDGKRYAVKLQVADKDAQLCSQIAKQYVDDKAVAIVAIATPAAQAAASQATRTPIIFAAITDPVAAKLVNSLATPGSNLTGTSNRWPFERQVGLIPALLPKAKRIGAIWNPSEANSDAAMKVLRPLLQAQGVTVIEVAVASTADVAMAARNAAARVDAFLMIPDNTALAATTTLVQIAIAARKPVIGGDLDTVRRGGLATFGYDYFDLGQQTAEMVKEVVLDKKQPASTPVRFPRQTKLILNQATAARLGIHLPDSLKAHADEIVQ